MKTIHPVAIITGASSGIGKAFAGEFARQGYNLILSGRRDGELRVVATALSSAHHCHIETLSGDLSDEHYRDTLAECAARARFVDILVNCAGYGNNKDFCTCSGKDLHDMIGTHDIAVVDLIHAVLPGMIARRRGTIINVSSVAAFLPGQSNTLYLATKTFVHGLSTALNLELAQYKIRVQSLCPGLVISGFHRNLETAEFRRKFGKLHPMTPEEVVACSMKDLRRGRMVCIPGLFNKAGFYLARLLPLRFFRMIAKKRPAFELPAVERPAISMKKAYSMAV